MSKRDVADFVCRPFCSFYREGVKEELICNGARIVEILVRRGFLSSEHLSEVEQDPSLSAGENILMEEIVCQPCPFLVDGCDFRSPSPPADAVPCGGYILLALLVTRGAFSMEALKEIAVE